VRIGIKAKQIAALTAIVGLAVVALSAVHVARLARVVLHESQARGELLANAIFHRAREVVVAGGTNDLYAALRNDPGLRAILESSIYGESVTEASILDTTGVVRASSDRDEVIVRELDLASVGKQRVGWPFFRDRRIDAYSELTRRFID